MEHPNKYRSLKNDELLIECLEHHQLYEMKDTHYHDKYEIYYQVDGDRYVMTNGKFIHVKAGNLIWIKKFDLHQSAHAQTSYGVRVVIYFTESFMRKVFQKETDRLLRFFSDVFQVVCLNPSQQKKVLELMYEIEYSLNSGQPLYSQFIFGQLLLLLEHWMCSEKLGTPQTVYIDAKHERISKVLSYLKNHCCETVCLHETAQVFHITPSYLSRSFKECTGISFVSYLQHLKIEKSKELLQTNLSITQVSLELGYESITHFERTFKKITGISPSAWKKYQKSAKPK